MKEMYKGKVNSPQTLLLEDIDSSNTNIKVKDISVFPEGPNLAVIGTDFDAETIKYTSINENILVGCIRGFQGKAKPWNKDSIISRNITEYDISSIQENVIELNKNKVDKVAGKSLSTNDYDNHAKSKVDKIPDNPKYTDTVYNDTEIRNQLNTKVNKSDYNKNGIGLGNVSNYGIATKEEAEQGTSSVKYMTPERTKQAIQRLSPAPDLTKYAKKTELSNKVDKVSGKGLSSNDFTNELKEKLLKSGIDENTVKKIAMDVAYGDSLFRNDTNLYQELNAYYGLNLSSNITDFKKLVELDSALKSFLNNPKAVNGALNSSYATMHLINNTKAMNTVINSSTAFDAVINNITAFNSVINNPTAMNVVINNTKAMNAVINNPTAMNAIANNTKAMNAVINNPTAKDIFTSADISILKSISKKVSFNKLREERLYDYKSFVLFVEDNNGPSFTYGINITGRYYSMSRNNIIKINSVFANILARRQTDESSGSTDIYYIPIE